MAIISLRQLLDHAANHGYGVRTVNIDTDLRRAATGAIRKYMKDYPSAFDPRKYLRAATDGMRDICKARYVAGNASRIKIINLEDMCHRYESGELEPTVK